MLTRVNRSPNDGLPEPDVSGIECLSCMDQGQRHSCIACGRDGLDDAVEKIEEVMDFLYDLFEMFADQGHTPKANDCLDAYEELEAVRSELRPSKEGR